MAIDYRSEVKRPLTLILLSAAVLGWLLALSIWFSSSRQLHESRADTARLQQAEVALRGQLDQQQRIGGTLADLEVRIADAQRQVAQLNQAREQAQTQLATTQETFQTAQQQLA